MKAGLPKSINSILAMLAVAVAYWLSATLGQMLTAPPVYATAVWPPSGIALGAVLIWGKRSLLGIALGAYLANGQLFLLKSVSLHQVLLPAGIAMGAVLQAAIIAYLIWRWAGYPSLLTDHKHVARFLLLAGPLGCCINASFGTSLLVLAGETPLSGFAINWATWWVGDTMGGLIFTPLMLIAFGQPRTVWTPRWLTVALPLMLCFTLATTIFTHVRAADKLRKRTEFINLVDAATHSIESTLQDFAVVLSAMKGLFAVSEQVSCDGLKVFTDNLSSHNRGFQALEWATLVKQSERKAFEQGNSLCGGDASSITERDTHGEIVPADNRDAYLPVTFIVPMASNRVALGFDLLFERLRRETILRARDTGNVTITPPIKLVQEPSDKYSVLMIKPIYHITSDTESLEGRRENFIGVVLGVLRIEGLVNTALGKLAGRRALFHLQLQDANIQANGGLLFAESGFTPTASLYQQRNVEIGGRVWKLSVSGDENDFGQGWFTWYVLAGGMLFSGLLGGFLLLLTSKTIGMEALIAERTLDLDNSNKRLREEVEERGRTEKAIQALNRSYQNLLSAASEVSIIATDPKGVISLFNRGAERMLGYSALEMVGKNTPAIFHLASEVEARGRELSEELGFSVTGFKVFTANPDFCGQEMREWTYVCKDGLCIWVSLVVTQINSEEGETIGYLGIAQNITERRAAEQALQKAKLAADKANQSKSEFLANMSHEIRTPMNGVLGMLELLLGTPLSEEQKELADTAIHSAKSLLDIINDILDFSKIEAGKFKLDSVEFNFSELCESVSSLLAAPAQSKGLEFNCDIQPDMHTEVRGDATRLRQVLVNLIGNAIKFTLQGEVSLKARRVVEDERNIIICLSVRDTGIGMKADEMSRLFMPFEQAEHGATRRFGGTGLGLSISRNLVELMGGEIGVESEPGIGSTFWFTVKLEKTAPSTWHNTKPNLTGYHVLVADDNKTNLAILESFLKSWGVKMSACHNGKQAMEMLNAAFKQGKPFDLAILDKNMPGLGGPDIIRSMAEKPGMEKMPCILLCPSGPVTEPCVGMHGKLVSLSKPLRQSQLLDSMASLLNCGLNENTAKETQKTHDLQQFAEKRLLLVEDNLVNQRVALKMLNRFGLTARVANDGAEALRELELNEFDLVFMDCQIPIIDGYSVTRMHRERELNLGLQRTPIVALTANAIQGDRDKSLAVGMDDHLTKPLSFKDLELALVRWLSISDSNVKQETLEKLEVHMSEPIWDYQATLEAACGDMELLEELRVLYISEAVKLTALLGTAEAPQAASVIATTAHTIKGMSGHFHAKRIVELSSEVERKAKAGQIDSTDPLILRLKHEVGKLIDALRSDG